MSKEQINSEETPIISTEQQPKSPSIEPTENEPLMKSEQEQGTTNTTTNTTTTNTTTIENGKQSSTPPPNISKPNASSYFTKSNNDFESLGIKTKRSIAENMGKNHTNGPNFDIKRNDVDSIPTYYLSEEEFQDPMLFIEKIQDQGMKFGGIKIIPPKEWDPTFALDIPRLKFRAAKQSLNHSTSNFNEKIQFYKDLLSFHKTKKLPLIRLPSIDRRVLDLFKLRKSVHLKGGFDLVCRKKLWAQIGRELGYTGRIMTSLSSSLKNSYQKVVHSYDLYLEGKDVDISDIPNDSNKRPLEDQSELQSESQSESQSQLQDQSQTDQSSTTQIENDNKKIKLDSSSSSSPSSSSSSSLGSDLNDTIIPTISNTRKVFKRSRDILKAKGFKTNYESYTEEKQGITQVDDYTYPYYDFNFWHKGVEVLDYPFPSTEMSQLYTLDEFFEIHLRYQSRLLPSNEFVNDDELINKYWELVTDKFSNFNVESASNLSTTIYGSGFPTMTEINQYDSKYVTSPWNLNNLPINEKGLLRYLVNENESITKPELDIGMLYSTQSWATEDHFLYSADYQHLGASKIHYFISPQDYEKFETLVKKYSKTLESNPISKIVMDDFPEPIASDVLETIKISNQFGQRSNTTNSNFQKFYNKSSEKIQFNSDLLIPLSILKENNINIYYTLQKPGQFIIKFPKSYSCSISLGFNLNEHVNFASVSWIDHALDGEKWLQNQGLPPCFSFFQLLTTIAEDSKDSTLLKKVLPFYNELIDSQFELRSQLKSTISNLKTISNKFDYISDDNLSNCFPTKIVAWQGKDSFNLQPENFIKLYENGEFENDDFRFEMHVYYTDDRLKIFQRTLSTYAQTPKDWVNKFEELLTSNSKPSIRSLKTLLGESERIKGKITEAEVLKIYLNDANLWIEKVQDLLSVKQKNRIRNRRGSIKEEMDSSNSKPELIEKLINEIPNLSFSCPEIEQLIEFANEIYQYEVTVRSFLTDNGHSIEEFYDMIDLGKSFGVELKSINFLQRIVDRLDWITRATTILDKSNNLEEYRLILDEGYEVGTVKDQDLIDKLSLNYKNGRYLNAKFKHFLSLPSLSIGLVEMLLKESIGLPIDQEVVKKLIEIKEQHAKSVEERDQIYKVIAKNGIEMNLLRNELQKKAINDENFNSILYETLKNKFKGDDDDIRPKYSIAKEILDKSRQFLPSNPSDPLDNYLRQAEDWLRRSKKLFGKTNAPFSVLKSHLTTIYEKNRWCFNCEDKYKEDLKEDDHKIFCFCRRLESGTMIACEKCNEWYHCKCLKFGRGKSKNVENYICPICDYRLEIPREYNSPKIEDLKLIIEEGSFLELAPDELYLIREIYNDAFKFQVFLKKELNWNDDVIIDDDVNKLKFYLRKLEGSSVLLSNEYNQLRQLIYQKDPICSIPPPIIENTKKTRKKRKVHGETTPAQTEAKIQNQGQDQTPSQATPDTTMDMSMIGDVSQSEVDKVEVQPIVSNVKKEEDDSIKSEKPTEVFIPAAQQQPQPPQPLEPSQSIPSPAVHHEANGADASAVQTESNTAGERGSATGGDSAGKHKEPGEAPVKKEDE